MSTQQAAPDYTVVDKDVQAFRETFPDIDDLSNDTLRRIMLQGKLDIMCLAVQECQHGFVTERQAEIMNTLVSAIRVIVEREVFGQDRQQASEQDGSAHDGGGDAAPPRRASY
ncbi:hypothetical protein LTR85_006725 [Meristemomyces frigidus]|nr:hypothetical protein LTR85_006725 [Meristemomyces frigidus]